MDPFFHTQDPRDGTSNIHRVGAPSLPADLTGWDLVKELHSIGLDSPGELARILEEEDPFKVMNG